MMTLLAGVEGNVFASMTNETKGWPDIQESSLFLQKMY
jgi:hypothetical protein